jgi:hypothetical protein
MSAYLGLLEASLLSKKLNLEATPTPLSDHSKSMLDILNREFKSNNDVTLVSSKKVPSHPLIEPLPPGPPILWGTPDELILAQIIRTTEDPGFLSTTRSLVEDLSSAELQDSGEEKYLSLALARQTSEFYRSQLTKVLSGEKVEIRPFNEEVFKIATGLDKPLVSILKEQQQSPNLARIHARRIAKQFSNRLAAQRNLAEDRGVRAMWNFPEADVSAFQERNRSRTIEAPSLRLARPHSDHLTTELSSPRRSINMPRNLQTGTTQTDMAH